MPSNVANGIMSYLPLLAVVVVMILITVIPNRKREKKVKEMLNAMKKGDYVKTIGGIHGRIVSIKDDLVVIETGGTEKSQITMTREAIATVGGSDVEAPAVSEEETKFALKGNKEKKK